jgi:hypothetical protein
MDKCIKENTEGLRSKIALRLGISSQGLASKLSARPVAFLESFTDAVAHHNEQRALNIVVDVWSRLWVRFKRIKRRFSLIELIELNQKIFVLEIKFPDIDRWALLQYWRELVAIGQVRICELTGALEEKRFGL